MRKHTLRRMLVAACIFLLAPWAAWADIDPATVQKLLAGDGAAGDGFGGSVSLSGDGNTAVIGAIWDDGGKGSVYVFIRSYGIWSEKQKLIVDDNPPTGFLGLSVSVSGNGDTIAVGAPDHSGASIGAAYIFTRETGGTTWTQQAKLTGNGGAFGFSVSVSSDGNTVLIGSIWGNNSKGEVYVFTRCSGCGTWTQQATLVANDGAAGDHFGIGTSLSADGNTALIGAKGDDNTKGSAYVFTRSGSSWTQQQPKLIADDGASGDSFGFQVSLSADGSTASISAPYDDNRKGAVYIFARSGSTWSQQDKLTGDDSVAGDEFGGGRLSADGNIALIGAGGHENWKGAAYVFTRCRSCDSWTQQTKLTAYDGVAGDAFGSVSLSANGGTALIGAPPLRNTPNDPNNPDAFNYKKGAAYVYSSTIIVDAGCTLPDAITAANTDTATGGCPAGAGADTISLQQDVLLTAALPDITSTITIEGNGHKIDGQKSSTVGSVLKITSASGNLILNRATVTGGTGTKVVTYSYGGGIYASGSATVCLNSSTVSGNSTAYGGGIAIDSATVTVNKSTVKDNTAHFGGGVYASSGTVAIINSTISRNSATAGGSPSDIPDPMGGGIAGLVTLIHSTVSENSASYGGGISSALFSSTGTIESSIISGNTASSGGNEIWGDYNIKADHFNVFGHNGESNAQAFSRFTPGSSDVNATSNGTNTPLRSIINALNGGYYHSLPLGSPAIDLDAECSTGLTEDQRGVSRPVGNGCDAGSYECNGICKRFVPCPHCPAINLLLKD